MVSLKDRLTSFNSVNNFDMVKYIEKLFNIHMEAIENQPTMDYRSRLRERMSQRYPDRNYEETEENQGNEELARSAMESMDDYEGRINDYEGRIQKYEDDNKQMADFFRTNPRGAAFLNSWVKSGSPGLAFLKAYGRQAFDALQSEDGLEQIAQIEAEEAQFLADEESRKEEMMSNLSQSFDALDAWGDERGLSDEEKVKVFDRFHTIVMDAHKGIYAQELFDMAWKADHYDEDVANARHEGEVSGRNAKIKETQRKRSEVASMPPALSGQEATAINGNKPTRKSWGDYLK